MQHEIRIYRDLSNDVYVARHSDSAVRELFGTDTLPTPFRAAADQAEVLTAIRKLNPDCRVTWNGGYNILAMETGR